MDTYLTVHTRVHPTCWAYPSPTRRHPPPSRMFWQEMPSVHTSLVTYVTDYCGCIQYGFWLVSREDDYCSQDCRPRSYSSSIRLSIRKSRMMVASARIFASSSHRFTVFRRVWIPLGHEHRNSAGSSQYSQSGMEYHSLVAMMDRRCGTGSSIWVNAVPSR
jgi:hypothetical protein